MKGASRNEHLERIVGITWIIAYHLQADLWFEWVDSESNWADQISRLFGADPVSRRLGFETSPIELDISWWPQDWTAVWRRIENLVSVAPAEAL